MEKYNLLQVPSCVSSSQYIYILYKFLFSFFCFWSAARDQYHIKFDQIKSTKGQAVSKWHFIRFCLNIEFILILQSKILPEVLFCFSTLWHNFCGCSGCYSTSQERSFPLRSHCQFGALNVCILCWFFFLCFFCFVF